MANIMSMKTVMNKPSRNGFDFSAKRNFTAKAGELLPVGIWEVLPGDKFLFNVNAFTRTQPVNTAAFARMREYYDFYYVPYHLLWNRANEVLSQMDFNQQHSVGFGELPTKFSGELPYVTTQQIFDYIKKLHSSVGQQKQNFFGYDRATLSCKLLEYLSYGDYSDSLSDQVTTPKYSVDVNVFGLLAYQKIYSDYFRDQQWEKPNPSCFNVDYITGSSSMQLPIADGEVTEDFYQNYNMFDLRYCNWHKDLYHGLLPSAQYGDSAVVPLSVGADSTLAGSFTEFGKSNENRYSLWFAAGTPYSSSYKSLFVTDGDGSGGNPNVSNFALGGTLEYNESGRLGSGSPIPFKADISSSPSMQGLSILALRQYEFLQKWKEIAQCGDQDYKGITKRIWGADVPDGLSDKCRYLGGTSSSMDINEVVNTNLADNNGASLAGKGVGLSNGKIEFTADNQYGIVMCIYHAVPLVDYTVDYLSPAYTRVNAEDFANPVFDRVGMQAVSDVHLRRRATNTSQSGAPVILGYGPRYIDYKTTIDLSVGAFKRDLQHWVVAYGEDDIQQALGYAGSADMDIPADSKESAATYNFLKVNPNMLDPIFAQAVDSSDSTDQFLCTSFIDVKIVRKLDVDGLPY